MTTSYKDTTPQDFLDVVEKLLAKGEYVTHLYLVERNKPILNRRSDHIDIKVEDLVATPVRGLRWDYLIGDDSIHSRQFIITNSSHAEYFIEVYKPSEDFIKLVLHKFKSDGRVYPHLLDEQDLKSGVEKKLELNKNLPYGKMKVIENKIGNDELLNNLLTELERISKE